MNMSFVFSLVGFGPQMRLRLTDLGRPPDELVDAAMRQGRDDRAGVGRRRGDPVRREAARQLAHEQHHRQLQSNVNHVS